MHSVIVPALCLAVVGLVLCYVLLGAAAAFYGLLALILLAWLSVILLAIRSTADSRSVAAMLKDFAYRVDHARQALGQSPAAVEQGVLAAFDKLHAEIAALLLRRKIRMAQIKREVLKFHAPDEPLGPRWRPPTLSEMGFVLAAADKFAPDAAVLALYKYSGEERSRGGAVSDTYTILKEGASASFSAAFPAKVQSPYSVRLSVPETADELPGVPAAQAGVHGAADSDHNVGYILSLLGPVTPLGAHAMSENLRAIARLRAAETPAQAMPAETVWGDLRRLLAEPIAHRDDFLAAAGIALRQAPQLFVCAMAATEHGQDDAADAQLSALAALAGISGPSGAALRPAFVRIMRRFADAIRSLEIVPAQQPITNPGCAYVEARGAEADAGMLNRIAQLIPHATSPAQGPAVVMVTHLTQREFQARLEDYGELNPGGDGQAVIETLLAALATEVLAIHTATDLQAYKPQAFLHARRRRQLILSADMALVDVEGIAPDSQNLLWTVSGRLLMVQAAKLLDLHLAALQIKCFAWREAS